MCPKAVGTEITLGNLTYLFSMSNKHSLESMKSLILFYIVSSSFDATIKKNLSACSYHHMIRKWKDTDWRDVSAIRSTCFFCQRLKFIIQFQHRVTTNTYDSSLGVCDTSMFFWHLHTRSIHSHRDKLKKEAKRLFSW